MKKKKVDNSRKRLFLFWLAVLLVAASVVNVFTMLTITGGVTGSGQVQLCFNPAPTVTITDQEAGHNVEFSLQVNATDSRNESVSYEDNTSLFAINATGGINFTPTLSQVGYHDILISVTDNNTACPATARKAFTLTVNNSYPVLSTVIPNQSWEEDVILSGLDLDTYFTDSESDPLNYTVRYGDNMNITVSSSGVVTFRPDTDFNGVSWVIFTANDTLNTTDSNNVTLTVTTVDNFCGDGICNSGEDCSLCSTDCGTCPAGAGSSSGGGGAAGGGGGGRILERVITAPSDAQCTVQTECTEWKPVSCTDSATQHQSCITVASNCEVREIVEERSCRCQPRWECSIWLPEDCRDGEQERTCVDVNNCGIERDLPLRQSCVPVEGFARRAVEQREKIALAGQAFFQNAWEFTRKPAVLWSMVLFVGSILLLLGLVVLLPWLHRDPVCGRRRQKGGFSAGKKWFCSPECLRQYGQRLRQALQQPVQEEAEKPVLHKVLFTKGEGLDCELSYVEQELHKLGDKQQ